MLLSCNKNIVYIFQATGTNNNNYNETRPDNIASTHTAYM